MMKTCLLIPCYNEGLTIRKVVDDFKREVPDLEVYVYDNNSTDNTVEEALSAGAIVRKERRQGKGNVVRSMFRDIDADIYIMVDGDDTYPAKAVKSLLEPVEKGEADIAIGDRLSNGTYFKENKRSFHGFGNNLVKFFINYFFRTDLKDIMTGYRVFSRNFVKTFPVISEGFQLETEMTIFALSKYFRIVEVPIDFSERPEGSFSKLNTFSDGFRVIMCIFNMYRHYKPLRFFTVIALFCMILSFIFGIPVIMEYIDYQYIYKVPSAILAGSLFVIATLTYTCGLILDALAYKDQAFFEQILKK
ncbi:MULTISPECIES: glycosyltransferase family 2 protein [Porphyromonadaceae]|nr:MULTISPECIES: glycosyltransferase family 2 protein [Porphyromonadaceae]